MATDASNRSTGVLYVADSASIGGGNRSLIDLVRGLDGARFAPFLIAPGDGALTAWARAERVPHRIVGGGDLRGRLGMLRRALAMLAANRARGAGIVHAMAPSCYRAAGLLGTLIGAARVCHLGFPPRPDELEWAFRFGPDAVVGCYDGQSRELAPAFDRMGCRARVVDIANGIDTRAFAPAPARPEWRFGAAHVVLMVGALSEMKGHPTFLRAAAGVAAALDGSVFLVLGDERSGASYRHLLEQLAIDLGIGDRVHFLGWRREVAEVMSSADVVVLPSLQEGLPLAVLEAMACARPVIAAPVGGVPCAVRDGETGLLVSPDDPNALAAAILRVLRDPELARALGEAARRRIESDFSLRRFVTRIEELYAELTAT